MSSAFPPSGGQMARRCVRCGISLPFTMATCNNCGAYNAVSQPGFGQFGQPMQPPQPAPPSQPPQVPQVQQAPWQQPAAAPWGNGNMPTSPNTGQYAPWNQPQPAQVPFPNGTGQLSPYQPAQTAFPGTGRYGPISQPGLNGFVPFAPSAPVVPEAPKSRSNIFLFILLGLLTLVLIGGGLTGWLYLKNRDQNAVTPPPTFVITTPTTKPLFHDTFTNNAAGWDLSSAAGKYQVGINNGSMTLEDDDNKLLWEIVPTKSLSDFRLDVDAKLSKGDPGNGYGVYIRGASTSNSDIGTYYRFELYGDGSFGLFKGTQDANGTTQNQQIGKYTYNSAILKQGSTNHITVIAKGSSMTFLVNGVSVTTYSDLSYRGGLTALFVSNLPNLPSVAQATFSNLAVYPTS